MSGTGTAWRVGGMSRLVYTTVMRRGFLVWDWDCMEGRGDEQTGLHHCDEERVPCLGLGLYGGSGRGADWFTPL